MSKKTEKKGTEKKGTEKKGTEKKEVSAPTLYDNLDVDQVPKALDALAMSYRKSADKILQTMGGSGTRENANIWRYVAKCLEDAAGDIERYLEDGEDDLDS